jgi:chromosome partitioning protein
LVADLVVVPCGASVFDLRAAQGMVDLVGQARAARHDGGPVCRLVLNRVQLHTTIGQEAVDALAALGGSGVATACRAVVRQRTALADAPGQARTVFDMAGAQVAADDLDTLFVELNRAK